MKQTHSKPRRASALLSALLTLVVGCVSIGAGVTPLTASAESAAATTATPITLLMKEDAFTVTNDAKPTDIQVRYTKTGLRLQSQKSGKAAEGTSFTFANNFNGEFTMDFRIRSAQKYNHTAAAGWTHYLSNGKQAYLLDETNNPYADVQMVTFRFTSKSDPSKYFDLFIRGSAKGKAFATSAGVYIPGDQIWAGDPQNKRYYGYGLNSAISGLESAASLNYGAGTVSGYEGLYTEIVGTTFSNFVTYSSKNTYYADNSANPNKTSSNMIKFDVENMRVYVNAKTNNANYFSADSTNDSATVLVRDLATNEGFNPVVTVASLSAADFAAGYNVTVEFTQMTSNECVGDAAKFGGGSNYPAIIETPYDRYADMYIYEVNGTKMTANNIATASSQITMEQGASVRLASDNTSGIRFTAKMDKTEYDALVKKGVKFYYEISAENGKSVTKEITKVTEVGSTVYFTAAVTGISEERFDTKWTAKVYLTNAQNKTFYAYGNDNSRSIKFVATAALADESKEYSEEFKNILKTYAGQN